jgi:hypothetical protein
VMALRCITKSWSVEPLNDLLACTITQQWRSVQSSFLWFCRVSVCSTSENEKDINKRPDAVDISRAVSHTCTALHSLCDVFNQC